MNFEYHFNLTAFLIVWYLIGVLVSVYFIWYYRFNSRTKDDPKPNDAIGALIGPWLFPLQFVLHYFTRKKEKIKYNKNIQVLYILHEN